MLVVSMSHEYIVWQKEPASSVLLFHSSVSPILPRHSNSPSSNKNVSLKTGLITSYTQCTGNFQQKSSAIEQRRPHSSLAAVFPRPVLGVLGRFGFVFLFLFFIFYLIAIPLSLGPASSSDPVARMATGVHVCVAAGGGRRAMTLLEARTRDVLERGAAALSLSLAATPRLSSERHQGQC